MVRALLDGTKTQTRRAMKPQPSPGFLARGLIEAVPQWPHQNGVRFFMSDGMSELVPCPYGAPGDRLWVKETWFTDYAWNGTKPTRISENAAIHYAATSEDFTGRVLRPCLFMRRWMSRITLEITEVRVERLNDISEADAVAEGVMPTFTLASYDITTETGNCSVVEGFVGGIPRAGDDWQGMKVTHVQHRPAKQIGTARDAYRDLWSRINGLDSWAANPWVWVIVFKRAEGGAS